MKNLTNCNVSERTKEIMSVISFRPVSTLIRNLKLHHSQQLLSRATRKDVVIFRLLQKPWFKPFILARNYSCTPIFYSSSIDENDEVTEDEDGDNFDSDKDFVDRYLDPKDRSRVIPPGVSMKYMESVAFKSTYGNDPIWKKYRRNYPVSKKTKFLLGSDSSTKRSMILDQTV